MIALLVVLTASVAFAQIDAPSDREIDQWMQGPEQHLSGWSVHFQSPVLTFELRFAIAIKAYASVKKAKLALHDVHVFVFVEDEASRYAEKHHGAIRQIPGTADLALNETFYAKPGNYRVAFAVYDPIGKTHGVWKKDVHVGEPHGLLPEYRQAAPIEFVDPAAPFTPQPAPVLPRLENPQPLQVDILLNLTERKELELESNWSLERSQQEFATQSIIAIANTLAAMPINGCVRLSAIDAMRDKVHLEAAPTLDPAALLKLMQDNRNVDKVDLRTLALRKTASTFIKDFVDHIEAEAPACSVPAEHRAIVVISDGLSFPEHSSLDPVNLSANAHLHTYFLRISVADLGEVFDYLTVARRIRLSRFARSFNDEMITLLKPLDPRLFNISQPKDFQKALTGLVEDLKKQ